MNERSSSISNWFFELVVILYLLHNVPVIGLMTPAFLYAFIMIFLYLCTIGHIGTQSFVQYLLKAIPITFFLLLGLVRGLVTGQGTFLADVYVIMQYIIYMIIGQYIVNSNNIRLAKHLYFVLIVIYTITAITSFIGYQTYPLASRELATTIAEEDTLTYNVYRRLNIGGFSFIYTLVLFLPLLMGEFKNKMGNRFFIFIVTFLFFIAIKGSQYTTALLLSLFSLVFLFVRKEFDKKKGYRSIMLIIILIMVLWSVLPSVLSLISQATDNDVVADRLGELSLTLSGDQRIGSFGKDSDLDARSFLYQKSLDSFLDTFPIGTWKNGTTGGHSFILDNLALYGIIGIIGILIVWINIYKVFLNRISNSFYFGFFFISYVFSIIMAILNPQVFYTFWGFTIPVFVVVYRSYELKQ